MDPDFPKDHPRNIIPELCRLYYSLGWMPGSGGSLSIKQGGEVYVTPSGVQKERIQPEDLFVQTVQNEDISGPTSSKGLRKSQCAPVFFSIYKHRGAGAVFHLHSKSAVLVSMLTPGKTFSVCNLQMIKVVRKWTTGGNHQFTDTLVIPIIDNQQKEYDLIEDMESAMSEFPETCAVLVRGHGIYAWGRTWEETKLVCESYDYLFDVALQLRSAGVLLDGSCSA